MVKILTDIRMTEPIITMPRSARGSPICIPRKPMARPAPSPRTDVVREARSKVSLLDTTALGRAQGEVRQGLEVNWLKSVKEWE